MRIKIDGKIEDIPAVWLHDPKKGIIRMIDQRYLPWEFKYFDSHTTEDTFFAIRNFVVRGAPTIGATAALGVYQAVLETISSDNFIKKFQKKLALLKSSRPTAYNLFHAIHTLSDAVHRQYKSEKAPKEIIENTRNLAINYVNEIIKTNKMIGTHGNKIIPKKATILTHCNAGALAAVDIGTATAPIYYAHDHGKDITVFVDETRPWLQGARLTAWELGQYGIKTFVISDNAAGYLMWRGEIDIVIVGADRIAINGDTANKIGTYKIALAAKDNDIPFYVAAPTTTIDPNIKDGQSIPIEERSVDEIHYVRGKHNGGIIDVRITPPNANARNPVFDITPSRLITGFITERGILRPSEIKTLFN